MKNEVINKIERILKIFQTTEGEIRPHFILTGPSGSGKSFSIQSLCDQLEVPVLEINAAQLTKEGTSGNSLSKALSPLINMGSNGAVCFVDEFDKLFISGNSNSSLAHETTNGVQNEFLKVLEAGKTSVYGDYGKYVEIATDKILFVFAGAFNGEENINIDRLREFGIKTEFLGRVGLTYAMKKLSLEDLREILSNSGLLSSYLALVPKVKKEDVVNSIMEAITDNYNKNTLGARLINTLIHQYFIDGPSTKETVKKVTFQKTLELP